MSTTNQNPLEEPLFPKQDLPSYELSQEAKVHLGEEEVKNRKWGEEEHILYILFLENNREKTKSKLIRRSNSFYKEMASFIGSKTAIQCRSHHQKYEAKYKYPHRIIKEEKEKFCPQLYAHQASRISIVGNPPSHKQECQLDEVPKAEKCTKVTSREISCQTDLEGVEHTLTMRTEPMEVAVRNNVPYMVPHVYPQSYSLDAWRMLSMGMPWTSPFSSI